MSDVLKIKPYTPRLFNTLVRLLMAVWLGACHVRSTTCAAEYAVDETTLKRMLGRFVDHMAMSPCEASCRSRRMLRITTSLEAQGEPEMGRRRTLGEFIHS